MPALVHAANVEKEQFDSLTFGVNNQRIPNLGSYPNELPKLVD